MDQVVKELKNDQVVNLIKKLENVNYNHHIVFGSVNVVQGVADAELTFVNYKKEVDPGLGAPQGHYSEDAYDLRVESEAELKMPPCPKHMDKGECVNPNLD